MSNEIPSSDNLEVLEIIILYRPKNHVIDPQLEEALSKGVAKGQYDDLQTAFLMRYVPQMKATEAHIVRTQKPVSLIVPQQQIETMTVKDAMKTAKRFLMLKKDDFADDEFEKTYDEMMAKMKEENKDVV